jgi:carotenoid cleavage dioxygenase
VYPDRAEVGDAGAMKNTGNTHIVRHAGQIYALMEAAKPTRIAPDLSTEGEWDFDGALHSSFTAHPKIDPETGEMLFFGYLPRLTYHVVDAAGRLVRSVPIDTPNPTMMHDFVTTRDHVVFFDSPAVMDFASFFEGGPLAAWRPEHGTRVGVLPREGGPEDLRWFDMENTWIAHFLNGYEDDGGIVVEGCAMDEFNFGLSADGRAAAAEGVLSRIRIDLTTGAVTRTALDDRVGDFPRINDDHNGLPNRYGYVAWYAGESTDDGFDALVKYDLRTGESSQFVFPGCTVGEFAFAPDPASAGEDDGWLVGFVHTHDATASDLCVFDAHDVSGGPIARVHMPRRVPFGFHGNWFAAD